MKTSPVVITPSEEVSTPMVVENETQRVLRGILAFWGPTGEWWFSGGSNIGERFKGAPLKACALIACSNIAGDDESPARDYLETAANEMGFFRGRRGPDAAALCSDVSFKNARKMVLRAIELAA